MVGPAADDRAEAEHGVELAAGRGVEGRQRDLDGAGHADHGHVVLGHAVTGEPVDRAGNEFARDELVEPRNDERELAPGTLVGTLISGGHLYSSR